MDMLHGLYIATVSDGAVTQLLIRPYLASQSVCCWWETGKKELERIVSLVRTRTNARCNGLSLASGEDREHIIS